MESSKAKFLKIVIIESKSPPSVLSLPRKKQTREARSSVTVKLLDSLSEVKAIKCIPPLFRTVTVITYSGLAVWNEHCGFVVEEENLGNIKMSFVLMEEEAEVAMGSFPLSAAKPFELSQHIEIKFKPLGSLRVQIGWVKEKGQLSLEGTRLQGRHPRRSTEVPPPSLPPTPQRNSRWGQVGVSGQAQSPVGSLPNRPSARIGANGGGPGEHMDTVKKLPMTPKPLPQPPVQVQDRSNFHKNIQNQIQHNQLHNMHHQQNQQNQQKVDAHAHGEDDHFDELGSPKGKSGDAISGNSKEKKKLGAQPGPKKINSPTSKKPEAPHQAKPLAVTLVLDQKKIVELEKNIEDANKQLQSKNAEIVKIQSLIQEAKDSAARRREVAEKNPEIVKLQRKIIEMTRSLNDKSIQCDKLELVLKRYSHEDNDARVALGLPPIIISPTPEKKPEPVATSQPKQQAPPWKKNLPAKPSPGSGRIPDTPEGYSAFFASNDDLDLLPEIREKFSTAGALWLSKFILAGGLESILNLLGRFEGKISLDYSMLIKVGQLVALLRIFMSEAILIGIVLKQYRDTFTDICKLSLLSKNSFVKSEICMTLAGLCLYTRTSYKFVQSLVKFVAKSPRPFFVLIKSLREDKDRPLMTACLCLINSLIAGELEIGARMKMRSLFLEAGIMVSFEKFSRQYPSDKALLSQIEAFEKIQTSDAEKQKKLRFIGVIDLHNPQILFTKILQFTSSLGLDKIVLAILQNMLLIPEVTSDKKETGDNVKAKTIMQFIERATRRVAFPEEPKATSFITYEELHQVVTKMVENSNSEWLLGAKTSAPAAPPGPLGPTVAPTPQKKKDNKPTLPGKSDKNEKVADFKDESVPAPRAELRHLYWEKIPETLQNGYWRNLKPNIAKMDLMFPKLEEMFPATKSAVPFRAPPKLVPKIALLPVHIANSISILRAQFGSMSDMEILQGIMDIDNRVFTTSQLEALLKCVPSEPNIIDTLLKYEGNLEHLREAERFTITLLTIDNIGGLLQNLIFKDEFEIRADSVNRQLNMMKHCMEEILSIERFQTVLTLIITVGDMISFGTQNDTSKLAKIVALKVAKNPRYNLSNFIVEYIDENFEDLAQYYTQIKNLEESLRYQPQLMEEEVSDLQKRVDAVRVEMENTPEDFKGGAYANYYQMIDRFLQSAANQLSQIESDYENFKQFGNLVLQAFGCSVKNPLLKLIDLLHLYSKNFRDIAWDRRSEREDYHKYQQIGFISKDDSEAQKISILELLIEGISRGDYSSMDRISQIAPLNATIEDLFLPANQPPAVEEPPPKQSTTTPTPTSPTSPTTHVPDTTSAASTKTNVFPPEKKVTQPAPPAPDSTTRKANEEMDKLLGKDEGGPNVDDLEALLAASTFDIDDLLKN